MEMESGKVGGKPRGGGSITGKRDGNENRNEGLTVASRIFLTFLPSKSAEAM